MTAFQRILINTERWNGTVVTPSLAKPHELICTPNITFQVDAFDVLPCVETRARAHVCVSYVRVHACVCY